jgi:hypothetical protein
MAKSIYLRKGTLKNRFRRLGGKGGGTIDAIGNIITIT